MNSVKNGKIEGMGMIRIKKIVGALIVLFVIIVNLNKSYGIYEKEILFISSYSPEFISFKDQVKGIKDTLGDEFNLQVQYMNAKSFSDKVDESDFYNLLKYSIASYKNLEGILIGDDDALEFYLKYKEDLFKDIPASFFGIYDKIISIVGIGANLPIISFGNTITNSVYYGYISDGFLGIFNNLLAGVSLGISATIIISFILIIFFKPKD